MGDDSNQAVTVVERLVSPSEDFRLILQRGSGSPVDVSIALAVHREEGLLRPTLASLLQAMSIAEKEGLRLEMVVTMDDPDGETRRVLTETDLASVSDLRVLEGCSRCLATARNAAISCARGEWICLADGDDLVSPNTFSAFFAAARRKPPQTVFMPQWLLLFGERHECHRVPSSREIGPLNLLSSNPFVSRIFVHRSVALRIPFTPTPLESGFAFEDWHHHCQLVADGCTLETVPDTILFYRVRSGGLMDMSRDASACTIPPSRFFEPDVFLARCRRDYLHSRVFGITAARAAPLSSDASSRTAVEAAGAIEPCVAGFDYFQAETRTPRSARHKSVGALYYRLCRAVRARGFHAVVVAQEASALRDVTARMPPPACVLHIVVEPASRRREMRVRTSNRLVQIHLRCSEHRDLEAVCIKILQSFAPNAALHIANDGFGSRFAERVNKIESLESRVVPMNGTVVFG